MNTEGIGATRHQGIKPEHEGGETLVRFEVWGAAHEWRGSGRIEVMTATPAEMTGEAVRRLVASGLMRRADRFRLWVPGSDAWHAEGEVSAGDIREVSLSAKITDREQATQPNQPRS